jgi:hypothetical protein
MKEFREEKNKQRCRYQSIFNTNQLGVTVIVLCEGDRLYFPPTSTISQPCWLMFKCLMTTSPFILLLVWFLHGDSIGKSIDDLPLKSMV